MLALEEVRWLGGQGRAIDPCISNRAEDRHPIAWRIAVDGVAGQLRELLFECTLMVTATKVCPDAPGLSLWVWGNAAVQRRRRR